MKNLFKTHLSPRQNSPVLIKLGGAALLDKALLAPLCRKLGAMQAEGQAIVLVHGGGPAINQALQARNLRWEFVEGQRVTTPEMMDTIEAVLCGSMNRRVVRTLNGAGATAVGLSGADGNTLLCHPLAAHLGLVGEIQSVQTDWLRAILDMRTKSEVIPIPVLAPVGTGLQGEAYNINADWAACRIALALGSPKLIYLTDQDGILDADGKVLRELNSCELKNLIETGVARGGMLTKVRTIMHALRNGVKDVHILNARQPEALGTKCRDAVRKDTAPLFVHFSSAHR